MLKHWGIEMLKPGISIYKKVMPDVAEKIGSKCGGSYVGSSHAEESHPHVHYMLWDNKDRIKKSIYTYGNAAKYKNLSS